MFNNEEKKENIPAPSFSAPQPGIPNQSAAPGSSSMPVMNQPPTENKDKVEDIYSGINLGSAPAKLPGESAGFSAVLPEAEQAGGFFSHGKKISMLVLFLVLALALGVGAYFTFSFFLPLMIIIHPLLLRKNQKQSRKKIIIPILFPPYLRPLPQKSIILPLRMRMATV